MSRGKLFGGIFVCGLFTIVGMLLAAEPAAPNPAELEAAMKAYMATIQPGPQHAELAKSVGEWEGECEHLMPGMPVEKSKANAKRTMIMGGRYLQEEFKGTMSGQPFEGMFLMGYDNNLKRYNSIWIDSMGTGMMMSQGKEEAGAVVCTGSFYCPMHQKEISARFVTTVKSADEEVFEMHTPGPDGKEMLSMRITYRRKK